MDSNKTQNKTSLIYIKSNGDWTDILKYGYTSSKDDSLVKRKYNSFEEHSHKTEYIAIFEITELPGCKFYKEKDKIISIFGTKPKLIQLYENKFSVELNYLKQFYHNNYHVDNGGGKEFMKKEGLETFNKIIMEDFPKLLLSVREFSKEEVNKENEKERLKIKNKEEKYDSFIMDLLVSNDLVVPFIKPNDKKPLEVQKQVLEKIISFYENNDIGKLVWACGLGKALCSLFICQKLGFKKILIGVPSRNLVNQFVKEARELYNSEYILGIGSDEELTTDKKEICDFIKNNEYKILITTYHSCHIIKKICDDNQFEFDFKIGDECHHLAGNKNHLVENKIHIKQEISQFKKFHFITSKKTLFMTATERIIEDYKGKEGFSMDRIEHFGEYIDKKSTHWAIENNKITDYKLGIYKNTEAQVNQIIKTLGINVENKELFLSAFIALKVMSQEEKLTHVLIYANKTVNADLINEYIEQIIDKKYLNINKEDIYHKSLHSNMRKDSTDFQPCFSIEKEVEKFKSAKLGIISCVQIFGEGFDLPKLNGVVIAESMDSEIRIVQSSLRPHRLEEGNEDKIAYVMCPFIDKINYREIEKDESYRKIKQLLFHLRNTDEGVLSRMKLFDYSFDSSKPEPERKIPEFIENEKELEIFRIFCRSSVSLGGDSMELDEYEFVRGINEALHLDTKQKYYERQKAHSYFVEEHEQHFRGIWKNWYHFLKIDTSGFIQNKNDWKKRCNELGINSLEKYKNRSKDYPELPDEPGEFYLGFSHIEAELNEKTTRRRY